MIFHNRHIILILILKFSLLSLSLNAQWQINKRVSTSFENQSLTRILYDLNKEHNLNFFFDPAEMPYHPLSGNFEEEQVFKLLQELVNGTKLMVLPYKEEGIVLINKENLSQDQVDYVVSKWKDGSFKYPLKENKIEISKVIGQINPGSTNLVKVKLKILESGTSIALPGAVAQIEKTNQVKTSDVNGELVFDLTTGNHDIKISYTAFKTIELNLDAYEDGAIDLFMETGSFVFDEVQIVANRIDQKLKDVEAGKEIVSVKKLQNVPQLLGSVDLIKSLELLPGVTSSSELSQGFNVRGGSTDQNLILLNDGIIFNPSHIVGFISAFNPDVLGDVSLYKSYVDVSKGGRVSGVLDMNTKMEQQDKWTGKGGVGTSMIQLTAQGPIKDKMDVLVAGRASFNDYILRNIANVEIQRSNAQFYDFNLSANYRINEEHKVQLHAYKSDDLFDYNDEFGFLWENAHVGVHWQGQWKNNWYSKFNVNLGSYQSEFYSSNVADAFRFQTGIAYLKSNISANKLTRFGLLNVGLEYMNLMNDPDRLSPNGESTIVEKSIQRSGTELLAPYVSLNKDISKKLSVEAGLRYSMSVSNGGAPIFSYENELEEEEIIGEDFQEGRDMESLVMIPEPRFSLNYKAKEKLSFKFSFNRMSQNIMQLSTTNSALPSDLWMSTNRYLRPATVEQLSVGLANGSKDEKYQYNVDVFWKRMNNLYELKDFADLILNEHLETELLLAQGKSYGVEFLMEKLKGKWIGSLAYTFSRSFRRTVDERAAINEGNFFSADFDIPHQVNLNLTYKWMPVVNINFAYVFRSGRPTTAPNSTIFQDGFVVPLYSERNAERIPYYSRVDLSVNLDLRESRKKGLRSSFNLGFYNLFGRNNPSNVFFRRSAKGNIVPFQFSVIGATIPNLSWNFVF